MPLINVNNGNNGFSHNINGRRSYDSNDSTTYETPHQSFINMSPNPKELNGLTQAAFNSGLAGLAQGIDLGWEKNEH
jgi:hypothetical protein